MGGRSGTGEGVHKTFLNSNLRIIVLKEMKHVKFVVTVEPRFNKVLRDWENLFVISRVRHIENLDLMNLRKNSHVRYIVGWLIDFFVVSGSSIESLVSIIIFDHRTWQRTQDC